MPWQTIALVPLLVAGLTSAAFSQNEAPKVPFEKYTLPNGLQLILHVDRKLPMVHVNLWYHVGSKNERIGRSGFAHLFEHMMFEGSLNAPGKTLQIFEKLGANLFEGGVNGTTDWDRTNYFETVPSGSLERVLWLESDRLSTLADALTQKKLDNQRDVVKNERRQGLEKTTRSAVNAVAEKYAQPANATLLLVGDLSKIEAGVRDLNLGDVVVLDVEGKPARK